jgi:hypothetical protein
VDLILLWSVAARADSWAATIIVQVQEAARFQRWH